MTSDLIKERRGRFVIQRHRREFHMKEEVRIGIILSQAKETQELAEAGKGKGGLSPGALRRGTALLTP